MKTITTYFLGATNYRGSRIKATDGDNSITLSWDHALDSEPNHAKAAATLRDKLGWPTKLIGGHAKRGMVWVHWAPESSAI